MSEGQGLELESNEHLMAFLVELALRLADDAPAQARDLEAAARFAAGSPSEFLHEASVALKSIRSCKTLTTPMRVDVELVIAQIDEAFLRVGGA